MQHTQPETRKALRAPPTADPTMIKANAHTFSVTSLEPEVPAVARFALTHTFAVIEARQCQAPPYVLFKEEEEVW